MIQIDTETMAELKRNLQSMKPFRIQCNKPVSLTSQTNNLLSQQQNETIITIEWTKEDHYINKGVLSVIDSKKLDGVRSLRINNSYDYVNENKM